MHILSNSELTVMVLDPRADVARLGSRYCTGGYIWQVVDPRLGELFTGPEYPREPNTFDGQGAPEMFRTALNEGAPVGGEVGCIGVGRVRRTSSLEPFDVRHNREVIEFIKWEVRRSGDELSMRGGHVFRDWSYEVERRVWLRDRTFSSETTVRCVGGVSLPIRWYAHPFFPIPADNILCRFSLPVGMPENPGYYMDAADFVARKAGHDWPRGSYQALDATTGGRPLKALMMHPAFGHVKVETDFEPAFLPIWGNDRTFSFEPYFERTLTPGTEARWAITYHCGKGAGDTPARDSFTNRTNT